MKTQQKLTEAQIEEIKYLAKTKTLKEIASHFNISTSIGISKILKLVS